MSQPKPFGTSTIMRAVAEVALYMHVWRFHRSEMKSKNIREGFIPALESSILGLGGWEVGLHRVWGSKRARPEGQSGRCRIVPTVAATLQFAKRRILKWWRRRQERRERMLVDAIEFWTQVATIYPLPFLPQCMQT